MKIKNKGKVHPSPSSSSSSSSYSLSPNGGDYLSVLKLLPAAILALASVLSLEDREVLAYLITRSMKTTTTTTTTTTPTNPSSNKKLSKKPNNSNNTHNHKPPVFDCDCFDCYRSYWFRWDSSPNRELIHQAIEAFEDHLTNGETEKTKKNTRTKRRDKSGRRVVVDKQQQQQQQPVHGSGRPEIIMPVVIEDSTPSQETTEEPPSSSSSAFVVVVDDVDDVGLPGNDDVSPVPSLQENANEVAGESPEEEMAVVVRTTVAAVSNHKGLARKVLPDVLGLFNSRLWSLWSPNV